MYRFSALVFLGVLAGCTTGDTLFDFDEDGFPDGNDCGPEDASIYPGADDPFGDDVDQNCDGVDGTAVDVDGDGYTTAVDCDDSNANIHPGAADEEGDSLDSNCDGIDGVAEDADGDQFSTANDCNDDDPEVHPGAAETDDDGVDSDCDGYDGVGTGDHLGSGSVDPPYVGILPEHPGHNDDLFCDLVSPSIEDGVGDIIEYRIGWSLEGEEQVDLVSPLLPASETDPGSTWGCTITALSNTGGSAVGQASVVVSENVLPSAPVIRIVPEEAGLEDDLICLIDTPAVDPDEDAVTHSFSWLKNAEDTGFSDVVLSSDNTADGVVWTCRVVASDPYGSVAPVDSQVTFGTPPACVDGSIEGDSDIWGGRTDIALCEDPTGVVPAMTDAQALCGSGWSVCSSDQFMARNDNCSVAMTHYLVVGFAARLDDGDDCAARYQLGTMSSAVCSDDTYHLDLPGSCSGTAAASSLGNPGRIGVSGLASDYCSSHICGTLCCSE